MALTGKSRDAPAWRLKKLYRHTFFAANLHSTLVFGDANTAEQAMWGDWFYPVADPIPVANPPTPVLMAPMLPARSLRR